MKKVKKSDLKNLICKSYLFFVKGIMVEDYAKIRSICETRKVSPIRIDVNSVCIHVYDSNKFDSEENQKARVQTFADHIEAITFGNLKVINMDCPLSNFTWVSIANGYEIID